MNTTNFRVTKITKDTVDVAFGPIHFTMIIKPREGKTPIFVKPASIYILEPEYSELITTLKSEWQFEQTKKGNK